MIQAIINIILSYLIGSISGSMVLGKLKGVDIRKMGSGNAGGTNAFRTIGPIFALGVIIIDILKGKPGIFSARWGGVNNDFNKAISKVFQELYKRDKNWKQKKIKARFICALSICYLDKKIISVLGKIEGYISNKPKGKNGFGYDPIFVPKNKKKTFGEMSSLQKYKIDHRYNAFKKIKKFL